MTPRSTKDAGTSGLAPVTQGFRCVHPLAYLIGLCPLNSRDPERDHTLAPVSGARFVQSPVDRVRLAARGKNQLVQGSFRTARERQK